MSKPMDICPKCGYWKILGPYYRESHGYLGERLLYRCARCNFTSTTSTLDAKKTPLQLPAPRPPRES